MAFIYFINLVAFLAKDFETSIEMAIIRFEVITHLVEVLIAMVHF